jgi:Tfp pilus assembly protein PilN
MIKINLLAEGKKTAAVRRTKATGGKGTKSGDLVQWLFAGALLLCVAGFGFYWWLLFSELREKEAEIARAKKEVAELEPIIKQVAEFKKKKAELERKIEVISVLKANQRGPVRIMDEISRGLPELMWLTKLDMNANSVIVTGQSFSFNAIASFIENLDKVPEFQEPELIDSTRAEDIYNFTLQFGYKPVTQAGEKAEAEAQSPEPGDNTAAAE